MTRAREGLVLAYVARTERGALQPPSPFAEEARAAVGGEWEDRAEELFGPDEALHAAFTELRDELLRDVPRVAGTLGELRLDTDLDVTHGVVRYLELVKLAALLEPQPTRQPVAEALRAGQRRARCRRRPPQQREMLETSPLDELILDAERDARAARGRDRARATSRRSRRSCRAAATGSLLSASDIDTYRTCPLKYKFARVFRIPSEPTLNQRFGILVHQVLERYHQSRRRIGRRAARPARRGLAPRRLRRLRRGAPAARQGRDRAAPLPGALPRRGRRAGLVRALVPVPHRARTRCAAASTASTACPTAATS